MPGRERPLYGVGGGPALDISHDQRVRVVWGQHPLVGFLQVPGGEPADHIGGRQFREAAELSVPDVVQLAQGRPPRLSAEDRDRLRDPEGLLAYPVLPVMRVAQPPAEQAEKVGQLRGLAVARQNQPLHGPPGLEPSRGQRGVPGDVPVPKLPRPRERNGGQQLGEGGVPRAGGHEGDLNPHFDCQRPGAGHGGNSEAAVQTPLDRP